MHKFTRVTFKLLDVFMIFMMVFGAPMSALAAPSPTGATIISDLPDYNPGATVTLTGAGWAAGESVDITVNDDAGQTWSLNSDPDPVADGSGAFSYQFQLPNWFVANYSVTATGATSGTATTSFTDLSIGTYDQCSNDDGDGYAGGGDTGCRWINGNLQRNNSVYFEGDATVQRVWLTGFVPGTTHTVTLKYGTTKGGKHAYDFLTTWDWSEDWIDLADRCQGITGCTTAAETYKDIPQDPNVPDSFEPSAPGDRQFVMRGGTLNSATTPTIVSGSYSGDSETTIVVSFTVASSGSMCPTSGPDNGTCGVALWFGAHVSAQANWGLGMGAGSIDGSPYHVALDAVDGASVGQRDNQMQANVVSFFPNGTIIIIKDAQPDDAQDFSFNLSSSTISQNFSLDDDGDPTLPNTTSPNYSVPPGTYTAKELNIPSGWTLAGLTCTISGTSGSSYTTDLATGTANITLVSVANTTAGDTVTCTYVDSRDQGYLKITKSFDPKTSGFNGTFAVVYNCGAGDQTVNLGAGASTTVGPFSTGTQCTVSEPTLPSAPSGWTFGTPSISPAQPVTITAGTSSTPVEVTVTNSITQDQGYLKITKSFDPQSSGFSGTFDIVYNCGAGDVTVSLAAGGSTTLGPFNTGTSCAVSEPTLPTAPSGWTFGTPSVSGSPATIVKGDQTTAVEVTVTNSITRDQGYFKITKSFDPKTSGFSGKFDIVYNCGAGDVTVQLGAGETTNAIGPFNTGTSCTVSEPTLPSAPTGWTFGTPSVSGSPVTITKGDQAAAVVVTVTNSITRDLGSLEIRKTLSNPDGASVPASFTVNYDCGTGYTGSVNVAPGSPASVNDIPTGSTCTVTEVAPDPISGYTWGTITYTPASVTINTKDQTFTITVGNSITRDRGSLKVNKTLNDGGSGFSGSFSINYDCGGGLSGTLTVPPGGSSTVTDIPTGSSCTVTEPTLPTPPTGYSWGTPVITGSPAAITTSGATVEVTVANSLTRDLGSLVLAKSLTGGPSGYTGPFTINYTCTDGTSGSKSVSAGSSETVSGIPTGTECTVSETLPTPPTGYSFGTPTFSPSDTVTIPAGNGSSVTVTTNNTLTRDLGRLVLAKSLDDGGSGFSGPFTIHWDCGTFGSGDEPINAGDTATITDIPTGTSCTVSEPTLPSVTGYSFGTPSFSPSATVTIPAGNGSSVTVTTNNTMTRDLGNLKIVKTVSNPDGATLPASFTVNYNCGVGYTGQVSIVYPTPGFATVSGIPTGNSCSVTEVAPTPIPNYTWGTITYSPASVTIDTKDQTFTITVGNSITRDRGSLTIVKKVINDNGGTATVSAFGLNTTAGSLTFDSGVANGTTTTYTSQKLTVVTGNYTLKESDVYGYTEGSWSCTGAAGTVVPTFNSGSVQVGKDEDVTCTITNNDQPGTIVVIKNAKPAEGSFAFTTTGTGYNGFTLTGATTGNGNVNSQTLNAGTYTVKEGTQLSWILTGIGGSTDINTPYNCVITGSGGSTGVGDLNTQTATISLKNGDTVTCTFENTGNGATRTQGFWATHPELAQIAWFGGTAFNHTFPGVAAVTGIGDRSLCTRAIEGPGIKDISKLMGGFWSDISKTSTGAKRSAIDQARMQLLQQLLAAELNASAFGSIPSGGSGMFAQWESALCGTNQNNITTAKQQAASFNSQGDNSTFTPGTSANSKYARSIADIPFWNIIKP